MEKDCNCRVAKECPMAGKCPISDMVYKNTVCRRPKVVHQTNCQFIQNTHTHKSSLNRFNKSTSTALSSQIKNKNLSFTYNGPIMTLVPSYNKKTRSCQLCLSEKTLVSLADPRKSLNKRSNIISQCRHRDKILLKSY